MRHVDTAPLSGDELARIDAYWRAANYLTVGQIYLLDNALLERPLVPADIKPRLLGHWGTSPGLSMIYTHLNRVIARDDLDMMYVIGPGHGGPAIVANAWLEGTYTQTYPSITRDAPGMHHLFRQFSFPGGIPSHVAPETPGSIHEGGELGYSLTHACGAAFDNPDLVVACVVGDGEAETGPLATSWHVNKFLDPAGDGAVLPILHLNGYKIANPTVLARIPESDLDAMLRGCGWEPYLVSGDDPARVHQQLAATFDHVLGEIRAIQHRVRQSPRSSESSGHVPPRWPMIVLRTPKGWTGPKEVDGLPVEGTWRAHQVPLAEVREKPEHLVQLEAWMRSYRPQELFGADGAPRPEVIDWLPRGDRRPSANPHANGGLLTIELDLPPVSDHAVALNGPGESAAAATQVLGTYLREVFRRNAHQRNFRLFGPDETASNRLDAVYAATAKAWQAEILPTDVSLATDGRVMEILSEHTCEGWLEGYLLTGRHGMFSCYEAFTHIIDSMFNQHAKWLQVAQKLTWRRPIPSLNYLLTSHVWRQDHNGFTHQDPGFIDVVTNKRAEVVRVYLPPDANTLLHTIDRCLRTRNLVNVVVAGKNPEPVWLSIGEADLHCARGIGIWEWASCDEGAAPDVVMACAGDVPTLETIAAVSILREHLPELRVRVVNVVDLMRLQPDTEHPDGLSDAEYDTIFTADRPVIFAFHGYPWLIHRLTYRRHGHDELHVRGYIEEGTVTTPFDMVVRNNMDRFHLVMDVIDRVPGLAVKAAHVRQHMVDARTRHHEYVREFGGDMPEVRDWMWTAR
ncbi:MAG TPA: phosphoketolase family protein [Acidimicrobiia bacterium]|jgi:xylulose-5-phosphate/fructose-6-phosphate phosphoketolase